MRADQHLDVSDGITGGHNFSGPDLYEPRCEKTNVLVSDQVRHKRFNQAVQLQKMARGMKFRI